MSLNQKRIIRLFLSFSLVLYTLTLFHAGASSARALGGSTPPSNNHSGSVYSQQSDNLLNVSVGGVFAFPVVQQPVNNAGYVSSNANEITQFRMASQMGNIGLLAHNHLAGKSFSQLAVGQEVRLTYDDGHVEYFIISKILEFQALQPYSVYSSFKDLNSDETLTAEQLFNEVYRGDRHVTFQTCIEANGNLSWGRLFIIAIPEDHGYRSQSSPYPS